MIATKAQLIEAGFTVIDAPRATGCWQITRDAPFYYFRPQFECNQSQVVYYCVLQGDGLSKMIIPGCDENSVLPFCFIEPDDLKEMQINSNLVRIWEEKMLRMKSFIESAKDAGATVYNKVTSK